MRHSYDLIKDFICTFWNNKLYYMNRIRFNVGAMLSGSAVSLCLSQCKWCSFSTYECCVLLYIYCRRRYVSTSALKIWISSTRALMYPYLHNSFSESVFPVTISLVLSLMEMYLNAKCGANQCFISNSVAIHSAWCVPGLI